MGGSLILLPFFFASKGGFLKPNDAFKCKTAYAKEFGRVSGGRLPIF